MSRLLSMLLAVLASLTCFGVERTQPASATGRLQLTFTERSPLSATDVVLHRLDLDDQPVDRASLDYNLSVELFDVFVPTDYNPRFRCGLFVWMGVPEFSGYWLDVLSRHKLIAVAPANARGGYGPALDAVHNMKKLYNVDPHRVYVSGFSRGGQMAVSLVRGFPDVFRGGLFLMGGYFYHSRKTANGEREPTLEEALPKWKAPLDQLRNDMRLVIMKGGSDPQWTPQEGRSDYKALLLDGFTRVTYLEVPGHGHMHPDVKWFEKGIIALDFSAPVTPPITSPTAKPQPLPGQNAQAQRILATAQLHLESAPAPKSPNPDAERARHRETARKYLQQLLRDYPTTPAAAKAQELLRGMGE